IRLLRAHIVADDLDRPMAGNIGEAMTVDRETVSVDLEGERLTAGRADVIGPDLQSGSLRDYVGDEVLTPETARAGAEDSQAEAHEGAPAADEPAPPPERRAAEPPPQEAPEPQESEPQESEPQDRAAPEPGEETQGAGPD